MPRPYGEFTFACERRDAVHEQVDEGKLQRVSESAWIGHPRRDKTNHVERSLIYFIDQSVEHERRRAGRYAVRIAVHCIRLASWRRFSRVDLQLKATRCRQTNGKDERNPS